MKAENLFWQGRKVTTADIEARNGHKGCVVWFTGLSGSGKSTIAVNVEKRLFDLGYNVFLLDGDNIRQGLNADLGFSPGDREENIRRIGEVCRLFRMAGFIVLAAFISPYAEDRLKARKLVEKDRFMEVYVKCSLQECIRRDSKGLYKKALAGKIPNFTGVSAPYEEPEKPELVLDTEMVGVEEAVGRVVVELKELTCHYGIY